MKLDENLMDEKGCYCKRETSLKQLRHDLGGFRSDETTFRFQSVSVN